VNRIVIFFKTGSFAILLFLAGVLLFNWPILSMAAEGGGTSVFKYLIIGWTVIVALLIVVGQCILGAEKADRED